MSGPLMEKGERQTADGGGVAVPRQDVRRLTPKDVVRLSRDLYVAGQLGEDEYTLLSFQPELHPAFARTIGALTGETAEPDRSHDVIRWWEDRVEFECRYPDPSTDRIRPSKRILDVLRDVAGEAEASADHF